MTEPTPLAADARPLRIALTADPELPVPPRLYGGIERIIDSLAREYDRRGHAVTVFAHRDSDTAGRLRPWPGERSRAVADVARNAAFLMRAAAAERYDVIHSFARIASLAPLLPLPTPKIMTFQRAISRRSVALGHALSRGTLEFTAISDWMMRHVQDVGRWNKVPNCVDLGTYDARPSVAPDAPLVFLGRVEEIKGPHLAIEMARRLGRRLVIAGNIPDDKRAFFEAEVAPHLNDDRVRYVGPVDDAQKNALLGAAAAFVMPILWDEPFGIVMIEAMACGAPVLGLRRGSVPEVVEDGITGFVRDDLDALIAAAQEGLAGLDRAACRARVERLYATPAVADAYLAAYRAHGGARGRPTAPARAA